MLYLTFFYENCIMFISSWTGFSEERTSQEIYLLMSKHVRYTAKTFYRLIFSYKGRISRKTYWLYFFISLGILLFYGAIFAMMPTDTFKAGIVFLFAPFLLALIYGQLPIHVKRLHDINLSGLYVLIFMIPIIGAFLSFIVCGGIPGIDGKNKYGDPP